jgi:hypothetical protein
MGLFAAIGSLKQSARHTKAIKNIKPSETTENALGLEFGSQSRQAKPNIAPPLQTKATFLKISMILSLVICDEYNTGYRGCQEKTRKIVLLVCCITSTVSYLI